MYQQQIQIGGPMTPAVTTLLIANFIIFAIQYIMGGFFPGKLESIFGLSHAGLAQDHYLWQLFTYMFLHASWGHWFGNSIFLWMFAGHLENLWGTRYFVKYYLIAGVAAGFFIALMNYFLFANKLSSGFTPTIGASGALYAVFLAYAMEWPEQKLMLIPIKIKYVLIIYALIEFFGSIAPHNGNISHIGHLGGLFAGLIMYLQYSGKINLKMPRFFSGKKKQKIRFKVVDNSEKAKRIIDKMLDKIAKDGIESLTPAERKELEWARKNYYPGGSETVH